MDTPFVTPAATEEGIRPGRRIIPTPAAIQSIETTGH